MQEFRPSNDPPLLDLAACRHGIRDKVLVGLVLFTLVPTGEALAGDQASIPNATLNPGLGDLRQSSFSAFESMAAPGNFAAPPALAFQPFSATEFRPRRHAAFDSDTAASAFGDAPMLRSTTVWQRMAV